MSELFNNALRIKYNKRMVYAMIFRINESVTPPVNEPKTYGAIYEEGTYVKDCDIFITEQMIAECFGNEDLIRSSAILEGAKFDLALKNFMKEGKDYKGLKKDLRDIIKANDLDEDKLKTGHKGFMHACKRICQVLEDIGSITGPISVVGGAVVPMLIGGNPVALLSAIASAVVSFIISRLFRFLWDTIEFNAIKEDAETIVSDLRRLAKKTEDKKLKDRYNAEADRLEESIKKYSNKSDYDKD